MNYQLLDAEVWHIRFPGFHIPDIVERHSLHKGDYVKLTFIFPPFELCDRERMWVKVTDRKMLSIGKIIYTGVLDNNPIGEEIKRGDIVEFKPENIIAIRRRES